MSTTRHNASDSPFDAVVVVGSQGALKTFRTVLAHLPEGFPAAVIFDLHRSERLRLTEQLLARECDLTVRSAEAGLALEPSHLYLAPPDQQLVMAKDRRFELLPPVARSGHPFADALLASAACSLGPRLIAVVLSGRLSGGSRGVREVKRHGGRVIVQEPTTAVAPAMPMAALASGCVDFALPPQSLGPALVALCAATGAAELFRVRMNVGVSG